jgi:hypothetical protein
MKTPLLLAALALLGSCASTDPTYNSHWNAGSAGSSAVKAFSSYDDSEDSSHWDHENSNAADIALTVRRHMMNDNPDNPLQMRRGWGDQDNPYNMTAGIVDAGYLIRDGVVGTLYVGAEGALMLTDVLLGVPASLVGFDYDGVSSLWDDSDQSPTDPEDFETKNF